jgi:hypothetical protein
LLDATEQANVSAEQEFEKYVSSIENKNENQTKMKQERNTDKDASAAVMKYLDEKVYHYRNKAGEDMVEVHANWLYQYDKAEKLPN